MENLHDAVVGWRLPDELADIDIAQNDRHLDIGRPQPESTAISRQLHHSHGHDPPEAISSTSCTGRNAVDASKWLSVFRHKRI